jgi:ABC-2 type transport system permease protein
MRWQMLANSVRSVQGAFELGARSVTFMLYTLMGLGLGSGLGIGAYIMASRTKWQPLPILFWVVFLVWQALPIALASFQEQFDLNGLLRFPVSFKAFYLLHLVFGLVDVPALLGGICSIGIGIGVALARPDLILWILLVLAIFTAFNIFTARAILAWLDRWLAQRKTREIVSALFLLLMLSLQLLNPALHQERRSGPRTNNSHAKLQHHPPEAPWWTRTASKILLWLPPGLAADGLREAAEHQPGRAIESLGILGLYVCGVGALLAVRLRAEYVGENLNEAQALRKSTQSDRKWLLDGSGPIAAIVEKELRTIPRSMPLLFALGAPLLTVLVIATILRNSSQDGGPALRLAFPLCVSYTLLGFTQMIYNNLGAEGTGIQLLFLSPTPMRTILLAKNLFHAILYGSVAVMAGIFAAWRLGPPDTFMLGTTAAWLLFALPSNLAAGNMLSLTMPYRVNLGRLSRQRGSQGSALISMVVQVGVVFIGAGIFELSSLINKIWLAPFVFLALAVVMTFVWMGVVRRADDIAGRNKDMLIGTLAKAE